MRIGIAVSINTGTMTISSSHMLVLLLWSVLICRIHGFAPLRRPTSSAALRRVGAPTDMTCDTRVPARCGALCSTESDNSENDDSDAPTNPYQDPNYPELEFVDYSDPDYKVDQGVSDEMFATEDSTEEEIEAMREERRRRNDEYQFETYYRDVLRQGKEYMGEWTVYKTSTFLEEQQPVDLVFPQFRKARRNLKVISKGYKVIVDPDARWRVDGEHLCHEETLVPASDSDAYLASANDAIADDGIDETEKSKELGEVASAIKKSEDEILKQSYWPEKMTSFDFRGQQGNMCVGNAYTICTGLPIECKDADDEVNNGPFSELRTEVGIQYDALRFRVKFDYSVKDGESSKDNPALHLKSMIVCREMLNRWPRDGGRSQSIEDRVKADALFGDPGAPGGLYDPPPVGSDEQAGCYMSLDLDGGASVLFPYVMDQHPEAYNGNGWVTSLDWTPADIRFQVDRKVDGGPRLKGLRTLELSEVQREDADTYRPRDGGQNMRQ